MSRYGILGVLVVIVGVLLQGCAFEERMATGEPIYIEGVSREAVFSAAEAVLGEMSFTIEKSDIDAGVITTSSLRGGQFFEFWRNDNAGTRGVVESNIHSIQRAVELGISNLNGKVLVKCDVKVHRLSIPEKGFAGTSDAAGMFTTGGGGMQTLELNKEQRKQMAWIDVGADAELESRILELIRMKAKERI